MAGVKRPSWDEYFMDMTEVIAKRSTCERKNLGALLVKNKRIISTGYNGSPPGTPHCDEDGCFIIPTTTKVDGKEVTKNHCIRTLHAEENAILQCALHGVQTKGATVYIMLNPCYHCSKIILGAGIKRVVYKTDYYHEDGLDHRAIEMLKSAGVDVEKFGEKK